MIDDTSTAAVTEEVEGAEVAFTETTEAPASLSIQDLANLRNIIDVASQRGAFKADEFTVVGATYTKLNNFIASVTPAPEATEEATTEDAKEATEE